MIVDWIGDRGEKAVPRMKMFLVVSEAEPTQILDRIEAPGWAPAILEYAERIRNGSYTEAASLRQASPRDLEQARHENPAGPRRETLVRTGP